MQRRRTTWWQWAICGLAIGSTVTFGALPDPAKGGKDGGPIQLLFMRGQVEIGFGQPCAIDETLLKKLTDRGYQVTVMRDTQPLTADMLKQFNTVVWIGPTAISGGSYFNPAVWRGGVNCLIVKKNRDLLLDYVNNGGGLFIDLVLEEMGMSRIEAHKELLAPFGLNPECTQVRDETNKYLLEKLLGAFPRHLCWTEAIAKHPATEGVKRIYYPDYMTRWDDNFTTVPLFPTDSAWTVLAKAMPGSYCGWKQANIFEPGFWAKGPATWSEAPFILAREMGKGRVAAMGISHFMTFYFGFSKTGNFWENCFGAQEGKLLEKGDGQTPSDLLRLMDNLFAWASEPGAKLGMGGFEVKASENVYDGSGSVDFAKASQAQQSNPYSVTHYSSKGTNLLLNVIPPPPPSVPPSVSEVWADKDPICTGTIRPMKILVGARTAYSDGKGTVEDYAAAAKKAGYDVVCFTETFESMTEEKMRQLIADCKKYSDDTTAFLAGVDIEDDLGNRFLLVGLSQPLRPHQLMKDGDSAPGKKLIWTGYMLLGMGDVLPIAAKPGWLATPREKGCLPPQLYTHLVGVALATYRGDKQTDDGMFAYQWCMFNSDIPAPVAVHEVYSPEELEVAAKTGLQCYVNSDTPVHAGYYFRQGLEMYGGNPPRYYVSSGPLFDTVSMTPFLTSDMRWWQMQMKAHGAEPITEVIVRDQRKQHRRFTPNATTAELKWNGDTGAHQWMYIEMRDKAGGVAFSSVFRNLPRRSFTRCMDRQNWFLPFVKGGGVYPGSSMGPRPEVPGVKLAAGSLGLIDFLYASDDCIIYSCDMGYTHVPGGGTKGGIDSRPIFNAQPIPEFEARTRSIWYPYPAQEESYVQNLKLKKDLPASGSVWPIVTKIEAKKAKTKTGIAYLYMDPKTGKRVEGEIPADGFVDFPANSAVGNLLLQTPLRVNAQGEVGFASPGEGQIVKAGTTYEAAYAMMFVATHRSVTNMAIAYQRMGFEGPSGYGFSLNLKQGKLDRVAFNLYFQAEAYGVAGSVKAGECYRDALRAHLDNANPNWPLGAWSSIGPRIPKGHEIGGKIVPLSFVDGKVASGRLYFDKDADFYYGNLLMASDPNLYLNFASEWTSDGATIEVHNPTDKEIKATVWSPKAIPDLKLIREKVTVPPGTSIYVEVK